ncbi:MAG: DUF3800 domain-containing protein [Ignavibacteriaceae bacterium]|nr:DUF3800 domain-containing protein [Ignavibacteriaceae bacterium]
MNYYLFLDESGDHGLSNVDDNFPIFVLSGILINQNDLAALEQLMLQIKNQFWSNKKVILHSRDIRKCEKEFVVLFDDKIKKEFYGQINNLISNSNYEIISSAIDKNKYIKRYGRLSDDVYEIALSFIIERSIFSLDDKKESDKRLNIIIERRGKKEDNKLSDHFQRLYSRGTGYVSPARLKAYQINITFEAKSSDIAGLQLADLIAYPIARHVLDPNRANPAFDIFTTKFYSKKGEIYGLKVFP